MAKERMVMRREPLKEKVRKEKEVEAKVLLRVTLRVART